MKPEKNQTQIYFYDRTVSYLLKSVQTLFEKVEKGQSIDLFIFR